MTDLATRLLRVLPHHGQRTVSRAGHDAGLPSDRAKAAGRELQALGFVTMLQARGAKLELTDAGRQAQLAIAREAIA